MALVAVACHRYFMQTGDEEFAARALDVMLRAVEHWERHRASGGLITDVRDQLFDHEHRIFRDGVGNPEAERTHSQTANCLAVWAGAAPSSTDAAILRRAFDPPEGLDVIPANALFFAMLGAEVLFEAGCGAVALQVMKERFGKMVDYGTGSLWETWYPHASLCQGTGAGLVYACARYLAGVYPAQPGYAQIGVDPRPCGLERVHARLVTPAGELGVRWQALGDVLDFELSVPGALRSIPLVCPETVDGMRVRVRVEDLR